MHFLGLEIVANDFALIAYIDMVERMKSIFVVNVDALGTVFSKHK
jgi:hypothetical protein